MAQKLSTLGAIAEDLIQFPVSSQRLTAICSSSSLIPSSDLKWHLHTCDTQAHTQAHAHIHTYTHKCFFIEKKIKRNPRYLQGSVTLETLCNNRVQAERLLKQEKRFSES